MPLQATSGAASYDAFGGGVAVEPVYIEQIFSTYLYTGNGSTQTITNGIDLSTKGGLVWIKQRDGATARQHVLVDTVRGAGKTLASNLTSAQTTDQSVSAFSSTGFTVVDANPPKASNDSPINYASWTFRKAPKFFDVVTYTGDGANYRTISHSLGSTPGCVIVKSTSASGSWAVWHRSVDPKNLILNSTSGAITGQFSIQDVSATSFAVANSSFYGFPQSIPVNENGATYVAYIFAHDAGGFGLTGTDNVISCGSGSWSGGADNVVNLGYEAQWVMYKRTDDVGNWMMWDTMRGMSLTASEYLRANLSDAAGTFNSPYAIYPTATGFTVPAGAVSTGTFIYIAIRRGPMKVPTSGTSVFSPLLTSTTSGATNTTGFPVDSQFLAARGGSVYNSIVSDRLRGVSSNSTETGRFLVTSATSAENTSELVTEGWNNTAFLTPSVFAGVSYITWNFGRAPSFFDEVCYTGNGTAGRTVNHNLGVAPELMIVKRRNSSSDASWIVYAASQGISAGGQLNSNAAFGSMLGYYQWNNTAPTASVFTLGDGATDVNNAAGTYVWYGFATCAGVSKCGTFTGNGSSQTINCGFTGGARFVMIKATSTTGDWMVADSARGIVSGSDPYLELNTTNAEVTGEDWLDTDSTGFVVNEVSGSNANTNGVTYIYLAIA